MRREEDVACHDWAVQASVELAPGADMEEILMAAMLEAAESASRELKAIAAEMASNSVEKRLIRDRIGRVRRARHDPSLSDDVRATDKALTCMLGALSEMAEMNALRLQKAMDRHAKAMSTLSNILRKVGETEDGVVKNLK
jgi:hypothetical protein